MTTIKLDIETHRTGEVRQVQATAKDVATAATQCCLRGLRSCGQPTEATSSG